MAIRTTNFWFIGAAFIMVACAGIHALVGGPEINAPLQASALPAEIRAVLAVCWHALTGLFLIFGAALGWAAFHNARPVALLILATSVLFAGLFVGIGIAAFGSVTVLPQWVIFAATIAALVAGLARGGRAVAV